MPEEGPKKVSQSDIIRSVLSTLELYQRDTLTAIRESGSQTMQAIDRTSANIDRLGEKIDSLTMQTAQLHSAIRQTNAGIERLNSAIDGHLTVAREQSANIAQLIELAKLQSATVDRLLAKN